MLVIYRLCSIRSSNPSPIFDDNKFELNKACFKSFVEAFKDIKPKVIVLADYCDYLEAEMIEELCPFEYQYIPTKIGINETCLLQYKLASEQDDEIILFLECDYWWNPVLDVKKYISGIKELGLVNIYNHPNYYKDKTQHSDICEIHQIDGHHFRSVETCTMSFGLRKDVLIKYMDIFNKYGYLDHFLWLDIAKEGQKLFTPIPTFATHSVKDWLSGEVEWTKVWESLL